MENRVKTDIETKIYHQMELAKLAEELKIELDRLLKVIRS